MGTTVGLRRTIAARCGFSLKSEDCFRKDELNAILATLGGEAVPLPAVYDTTAPTKRELYQRLGEEAGFTYVCSGGTNARPLNYRELQRVLDAVSDEDEEEEDDG